MTDLPAEDISLETPRDWVRQGEERAERQWAASHPARTIEPTTAEKTARWLSPVLFALILGMALAFLAFGPKPSGWQVHRESGQRGAISHPAMKLPATLNTSAANVTLTSCDDSGVTGTLTNKGSHRQDFRVLVSIERGRQDVVVPATSLLGIPAGETVIWRGTVISLPLGPVSCSLVAVTSKPAYQP